VSFLLQAKELIELKKQQLTDAKLWRKQQEEYEVCGHHGVQLPAWRVCMKIRR
jgi:hypothetical protein